MEITIVDGDRRREAFANPVINYRLLIRTSSRCSGFESKQRYKTVNSALKAADRVSKLLKSNKD